MDLIAQLARELNLKAANVEAAVKLIDEGNTIPFISRYRKEATGGMDDVALRALDERLSYLRNLEQRKEDVILLIDAQGKLTPELEQQIREATQLQRVEDLYKPYRKKRMTRAQKAREAGLEPLANMIIMQASAKGSALDAAAAYVNEEAGFDTPEKALAGAADIVAETVAEDPENVADLRAFTQNTADIVVEATDPAEKTPYEPYYSYDEPLRRIPNHRVLAIDRGEREGKLRVRVNVDGAAATARLGSRWPRRQGVFAPIFDAAIADGYKRLMAPSLEREARAKLTVRAQTEAINVFAKNLEGLLSARPVRGARVLALDPGYRTGCKVAVIDDTGKVLDTTVVYPTAPTNEKKIRAAKDTVEGMIKKYGISLISVGNGTASRESEQVIVDMLKEIPEAKVQYVITNEAGASVYSASKLATEEFPNFDVGQRSAASIARRVQDPLAELVKIDPKSIGVGQYQHDMNQKKLGEALTGVVEDSVNKVGVDLNTASASLLEYISGVSKAIAKNIVVYREENGRFTTRKELLKVAKLGPKAFEQCAGFMRITGGTNPLDATSVHPESYEAASRLLEKLGYSAEDIAGGKLEGLGRKIKDYKKLAAELEIGEITLRDIVKELEKPARDPRDEMPKPILRTDVLDIKDLKEGMVLKGTVRNVIDFGAFVDIGVHQDGLVHISQMSEKFIKHPLEAVSVGDVVEVRVLGVDEKKNRISLSMKGLNK